MPIFGTHQDNTLEQLADVATRADRVALMADGHLGYIMPVGGVAAYSNKASVAGVGFDIACGNAAIRTDLLYSKIADQRNEIADEIWNSISFGIGRNNESEDAPTDDPLFDDPAWDAVPGLHERQKLRARARNQLGTVGSGNHYIDIFEDENGYVWVGVHFGSRGFGWNVAMGFMALSQGRPWGTRVKEAEALFDLDTPMGDAYWQLMSLAGRYAYVGREWVVRKIVALLGANELELVHNHHNFAWKEKHIDHLTNELSEFVIVRKGATPAFPGQRGFVGGSMGDNAVIVEGSLDPEALDMQTLTMFSTVHGAGRVMSRTEARGKINRKTGEIKKAGKVSPEMMAGWLRDKNVVLRGGGLDESPHAYRRLPSVLAEQGETINVLHTLRPVIVAMAGANEFDPFKD
jgi:tRNA-splicing ligase RtcB